MRTDLLEGIPCEVGGKLENLLEAGAGAGADYSPVAFLLSRPPSRCLRKLYNKRKLISRPTNIAYLYASRVCINYGAGHLFTLEELKTVSARVLRCLRRSQRLPGLDNISVGDNANDTERDSLTPFGLINRKSAFRYESVLEFMEIDFRWALFKPNVSTVDTVVRMYVDINCHTHVD